MGSRLLTWLARLAAVASLVGCSGSDSEDSIETGSLEAFSSYCTGTLKESMRVGDSTQPGGWTFSNTSPRVGSGTSFLVASDWNKWSGYVILADGTPAKLEADELGPGPGSGLIVDHDFTSACATEDKKTDFGSMVLLADATFHASKDLSGTPCTLPVATKLTSHGFSGGTEVAMVSADQIESACGLKSGYTKDLVYGALIDK